MISLKHVAWSVFVAAVFASAQTPPNTAAVVSEPAITQIRKSVTFIRLICNNGPQVLDVRGTGFFVGYPDERLGEDNAFVYLVTNRHVALCWDEKGEPQPVRSISIRLNRRNGPAEEIFLNNISNIPWALPSDDSVDLAAIPILPDQALYDYKIIPLNLLVTPDFLKQRNITEGEPVLFAGFFYQFPGATRMEPIVRQGIIAMMPQDPVPFINRLAKVYLADLHVFGGNSGSPAFINLGGFHGGSIMAGEDYHLLGVVNAEVSEDNNFNLELSATIRGSVRANSGVATIVPANEIKKLLEEPRLQQLRDAVVKARNQNSSQSPAQPH
ncbi:MAG TPA: hypothetical protein VIM62_06060 [Acidobacteriaceae bacterium]